MQNISSFVNEEIHAIGKVEKRMKWVKQWPWILLACSLLVSIATGIPGIQGLTEAS